MSHLLLIDANTADRGIVRSRLADDENEVRATESAALGIEEALTRPYDLVLVAARLEEGRSGAEVCRSLLGHHELEETPVIVYSTDQPIDGLSAAAYDSGAYLVVGPSELDDLERIVACALRDRARTSALSETRELLRLENRKLSDSLRRRRSGLPARGGDEEQTSRAAAAGHPDALLVVDRGVLVRWSDRGAGALFGRRLEGTRLRDLAPGSDLDAFVRTVRVTPHEGFRFDLPSRQGRPPRPLVVSTFPLQADDPLEGSVVVLLNDIGKRRLAEELVLGHRPAIPAGQLAALMEAARRRFSPAHIPGSGATVVDLRRRVAARVADRDPVLLVGEPGTGRGFLAAVLHYQGESPAALLDLRCSALAPEAIDAELFGLVRGAEGALTDRPGLLLLARGGTLYVSEVADLPLETQGRILEVLCTGSLLRPGAEGRESTDARLIASTRHDLGALATEGRFHPGLAERLLAGRIVVPALRERADELPTLIAEQLARLEVARIHERALRALLAYPWPGNLAQLEEVLEAAARSADGGELSLEHLGPPLRDLAGAGAQGRGPLATRPARRGPAPPVAEPGAGTLCPWDITEDDPVSFELYEKKAILRALHRCGGDRLAAAELLKLGKSTLYRKIRRFDIA